MILSTGVDPAQPRSKDAVTVNLALDSASNDIRRVTLRWERVTDRITPPESMAMDSFPNDAGGVDFTATLPPGPSQSLVRCQFEVELESGTKVTLPHPADPAPFVSYFIYDGEVAAKLPVLWLLRASRSGLVQRIAPLAGAVILEDEGPSVFDGAQLRGARNGIKLKFLKGAEYHGDRTLNILPEEGLPIATLTMAPHLEHFGFETFHEMGGLAPWVKWFRVIDYNSSTRRHTQRLIVEQVNERFLALNGLDANGDLYKLDHTSFSKQTNLETGSQSLLDLLAELGSGNDERARKAVFERFDLDNFCLYSVVGELIQDGDGYSNNLFLYNDLTPAGRWKVIPWDLDMILVSPGFPLNFPINGTLSRHYHFQSDLDRRYRGALKAAIAPGGPFALEKMIAKAAAIEGLLLVDLQLQESYLGTVRTARREQIVNAYRAIRDNLRARIAFLENALR